MTHHPQSYINGIFFTIGQYLITRESQKAAISCEVLKHMKEEYDGIIKFMPSMDEPYAFRVICCFGHAAYEENEEELSRIIDEISELKETDLDEAFNHYIEMSKDAKESISSIDIDYSSLLKEWTLLESYYDDNGFIPKELGGGITGLRNIWCSIGEIKINLPSEIFASIFGKKLNEYLDMFLVKMDISHMTVEEFDAHCLPMFHIHCIDMNQEYLSKKDTLYMRHRLNAFQIENRKIAEFIATMNDYIKQEIKI